MDAPDFDTYDAYQRQESADLWKQHQRDTDALVNASAEIRRLRKQLADVQHQRERDRCQVLQAAVRAARYARHGVVRGKMSAYLRSSTDMYPLTRAKSINHDFAGIRRR